MPISAARNDVTVPDPQVDRHVDRVGEPTADETDVPPRDGDGPVESDIEDHASTSISQPLATSANGIGEPKDGVPHTVGGELSLAAGEVFALDELLEDFSDPPAEVLRQVGEPPLGFADLALDGATAA